MKLTQDGYINNIETLINLITETIEKDMLSTSEKCIIETTLGEIISYQIEPEKWLSTLNSVTELELAIAEKHNFKDAIINAREYLKECK